MKSRVEKVTWQTGRTERSSNSRRNFSRNLMMSDNFVNTAQETEKRSSEIIYRTSRVDPKLTQLLSWDNPTETETGEGFFSSFLSVAMLIFSSIRSSSLRSPSISNWKQSFFSFFFYPPIVGFTWLGVTRIPWGQWKTTESEKRQVWFHGSVSFLKYDRKPGRRNRNRYTKAFPWDAKEFVEIARFLPYRNNIV